ncbi:helix-turn-helix transcriptional regulator [Sediminibacterium soli]|uniref:helix-turn-helix transcriptional regulator n=1 Tax=Sediminibacterium soli TaxID=2698829 RepID=UPI00137B1BCC|nr:YafY family protein [Sediminibacterium soli]NCI45519.1 YafY family transcriptional regulator [Sediminibacterium soli]
MNRIDRMAAILIQLQSKRVVKAQEIADRFSVSLRTVYRDIRALDESGVPIIGEAGTGYSIMEGYRLPPVMFTKEEATALLTAEKLVGKLTDTATREVYQAAMFKIKSVLRMTEKDHLENMDRHIEVVEVPAYSKTKTENAYIQQILKAIAGKLVLNIDYFAEHNQEITNRNAEPVGIYLMGRYWYLIAYCHLRKDYRTFKIDNIRYLSVTSIPYDTPHPALQSFLKKVCEEQELHAITILVEKEVMKWLGEQKFYHGFLSQKDRGKQVELRFLSASLSGFARWFMLYGEMAEIIEPYELNNLVRKNIENLAGRLK